MYCTAQFWAWLESEIGTGLGLGSVLGHLRYCCCFFFERLLVRGSDTEDVHSVSQHTDSIGSCIYVTYRRVANVGL